MTTKREYNRELKRRQRERQPTLYIHGSMIQRCYNPQHEAYHNYGGRGIKVDDCLKDAKDYQDWFERRFGMCRPPEGMTVDRIDNDGDYTPSNLRLATRTEQAANRRAAKVYFWNGQAKTMTDWGAEVGIDPQILRCRVNLGWTVEEALSTPLCRKRWKRRNVSSVT